MKKRIFFPVALVVLLLLGQRVIELPVKSILAQSELPSVTIATNKNDEAKEVAIEEPFNVTVNRLNQGRYVVELPKELDWIAPEKELTGMTYSEKTRQLTLEQASEDAITFSLKANTVGTYQVNIASTVEKQESVLFEVNAIEKSEAKYEEADSVQNEELTTFAEAPQMLPLNRLDDLTGWDDISSKSFGSWVFNQKSEIFSSTLLPKGALITSLNPGGGRNRTTADPTIEEQIRAFRVDVPGIQYHSRDESKTNSVAWYVPGTISGFLGKSPTVNSTEGTSIHGETDFKSLGLVVAVNNDINTLQEISVGPKTQIGYPSDESKVSNVDIKTFKVYKKANALDRKFAYDVTIGTYKFHVTIAYIPNFETDVVNVVYTYTNIGDSTIPGLMTGFNYTPEFRTAKITTDLGAIGTKKAGVIQYMGNNKGIFGTATEGGHRAEIYPNYREDGPDSWAAWSESFKSRDGNRDITKFMNGFKNPTDLYSEGDERDAIAPNTQINENTATNTNATISMKWNPQDLAVGESRTNSWAYATEAVSTLPKLKLDENDAYYSTDDNSGVIKGTWRNYEDGTSINTIKYSIDGGAYQNYPVSYKTLGEVGLPQDFEIPISLVAPGDHTVRVYLSSSKGINTSTYSKIFKFKAPKPKFNSTISVKTGAEERTTLSPGEDFNFDLAMNMTTQYSQLIDSVIQVPIDATRIDVSKLKDLSITKQDGTKGTISFNATLNQLEAQFPTSFVAGETLNLHFAGQVIDLDELVDQQLIFEATIKGTSGDSVKEDFELPVAEKPVKKINIIPAIATVTVNFLDGDRQPIVGYTPYELIGKTNEPYNLFLEYDVITILEEIESKGYVLTDSPANESGIFNRNGTVVDYIFNGSINFTKHTSTVDFGKLKINSNTQIYKPQLIDDGKGLTNNLYFEISDTRNKAERKPWEIKASVVQELTAKNHKVPLPGNFIFKTKDKKDITLNKSEEVIYKQLDTTSQVTKISFDSNLEEGLKLKVNPGIYADDYQGSISYTLENAP